MSKEKISRRVLLTGASSLFGAVGAVFAAVPFFSYLSPSRKAKLTGAAIKVDISNLKEDEHFIVEWRRKPIIIHRRTKEQTKAIENFDSDLLADPNSDYSKQPAANKNKWRSLKKEIVVVFNVCTHLGCAPQFKSKISSEWQGGFFCSCHGSKFDLAGRVFKNVPAPTNMEVPPYHFVDDKTILIGEIKNA